MAVLRDHRRGHVAGHLVQQLLRRLDAVPVAAAPAAPANHSRRGRARRRGSARAPRRATRSRRGSTCGCASAQVGKWTCASLKPGQHDPPAEVDHVGRGERRLVDADAARDPLARDRERPLRRDLRVERADRGRSRGSPCGNLEASRPRTSASGQLAASATAALNADPGRADGRADEARAETDRSANFPRTLFVLPSSTSRVQGSMFGLVASASRGRSARRPRPIEEGAGFDASQRRGSVAIATSTVCSRWSSRRNGRCRERSSSRRASASSPPVAMTAEALLVSIGAPRLAALGRELPPTLPGARLRLYELPGAATIRTPRTAARRAHSAARSLRAGRRECASSPTGEAASGGS